MEKWFAPNVASDILPLFEGQDAWPNARGQLSTLQMYIQNVLADEPGQMGVAGNTYPALCDVHAFERLRDWGLALAIEGGAVKTWSHDGHQALDGLLRAIDRVRDASGEVAAVALDEPLGARDTCHLTTTQVVEATCYVIEGIRAHGVRSVGIIEPYPSLFAAEIIEECELIQRAGSSPSFLHLDVDRYGIRDQVHGRHLSISQVRSALGRMQMTCTAWGIPLGVIMFGQRVSAVAAYRDSVVTWSQQLFDYLGQRWPDRKIIQSWELAPDGSLTLPYNLPETDLNSHTALITQV
jgi:hypothetical protein